MIKRIAYTGKKPFLRLEIHKDSKAGFYLIIYPKMSNKSIKDYLCDTLDEAYKIGEEEFKISQYFWK